MVILIAAFISIDDKSEMCGLEFATGFRIIKSVGLILLKFVKQPIHNS